MAEYGAHHATQGETKPSIFEVLGQENLVTGLRLAFSHIFKVNLFISCLCSIKEVVSLIISID